MAYDNFFLMDTQSAYSLAAVLLSSYFCFNLNARHTLLAADFLIEIILNNGISVYGDSSLVK